MLITLTKSELCGEVIAPSSKSVAHRALICAALAQNNTYIKGRFEGDDVFATVNALRAVGCQITEIQEGFYVEPQEFVEFAEINCGESGSTLRFMLPVVAALGIKSRFFGQGRLGERPLDGLKEVLQKSGVHFEGEELPFCMDGKLSGDLFEVDASVSSQYVTGLLLAMPLIGEGCKIKVLGEVSKSYIDVTIDVMRSFGVQVVEQDGVYTVCGKYSTTGEYLCESDFSSAAFFAVGGALCGEIVIGGLNMNSRQGDKEVFSLLDKMNASVTFESDKVIVRRANLGPIKFDAENIPDLVPIMSVAAATVNGISIIENIGRLRLKESDRASAVVDMLARFGVSAVCDKNALTIYGKGLTSGNLVSYNDHRLVMSGAIGACFAFGQSKIEGAEAVNKSYPSFFKDLAKLGGKIK